MSKIINPVTLLAILAALVIVSEAQPTATGNVKIVKFNQIQDETSYKFEWVQWYRNIIKLSISNWSVFLSKDSRTVMGRSDPRLVWWRRRVRGEITWSANTRTWDRTTGCTLSAMRLAVEDSSPRSPWPRNEIDAGRSGCLWSRWLMENICGIKLLWRNKNHQIICCFLFK